MHMLKFFASPYILPDIQTMFQRCVPAGHIDSALSCSISTNDLGHMPTLRLRSTSRQGRLGNK